jgi:peptidoglycan/LPS O-acetylase OafA/YrhL
MSVPSAQETLHRLDFVDSIRGLAALYVVTFHLVYIPNPSLRLPFWVRSFITNGDTGVTLFFIVSAFTLAYSMNQRGGEPRSTLRFYVRRFFRIVPLFYFWIFLTSIRDFVSFRVTHSIQDILLSVFFVFNFIPGKSTGIVWASWTLGIEMIFYLLFPLIYKYINNFWKSVGFIFITMLISSFWVQNLTHYVPTISDEYIVLSFIYRLPTFAFGIMLFFVFEKIIKMNIRSGGIAFMLLSASVLGYYSMISGKINNFGVDDLYWEAAICSLFVLGLAISPIKIFVNKITKFYGEISYSLYLNHPPLIFLMIPVFRYFYSLSIPTTVIYGISLTLLMIPLTIISYFTYNYIEKPGMRLGRSIIKKYKYFS